MPHIAMPRLSITVHLHGSNSYCGQAQIAFPMPRIQRSPEAALYRPLYKTAEWQRLRERVLVRDRYTCQRPGCGRLIVERKQAIVHHKRPHKGDRRLFFDETNCEVTCKPCHDGEVQSAERRGYSAAIGSDGWPLDSAHPANRNENETE